MKTWDVFGLVIHNGDTRFPVWGVISGENRFSWAIEIGEVFFALDMLKTTEMTQIDVFFLIKSLRNLKMIQILRLPVISGFER